MTDPNIDTIPTASTRPTLDDFAVRVAAVRARWARVRDWLLGDDTPPSEIDDNGDRVVREIADALEYGETGYHVCRSLDRAGWSPDDGLVEIMGDVLHARHDVLRAIEEEWVAANDIRPAHAIGDVVSIAAGGLVWCGVYALSPEARAGGEAPCYGAGMAVDVADGKPVDDAARDALVSLGSYGLDADASALAASIIASARETIRATGDFGGIVAEVRAELAKEGVAW